MPKQPQESTEQHNIQAFLKRRYPDKTSKKVLISRPEGRAGRANGYNVQEAMGLKNKGEEFCRILRLIRSHTFRYLNPQKTIQKQDQTRVDMVIKLTMEKYPFLQRFQGGWAVRDLMTKTLQNSVNTFNKDEKAEALTTEQRAQSDEAEPPRKKCKIQSLPDSDASDDSDGGSNASLGYNDESAAEEGSENDEAEEEPVLKTTKKSTKKVAKKSSERTEAESDEEDLVRKKTSTKKVKKDQKRSSKCKEVESDDEEVSKAAQKSSKKAVKKPAKRVQVESGEEEIEKTAKKINESEKTVKKSSKKSPVEGDEEEVGKKKIATKLNEKEQETNDEGNEEVDTKRTKIKTTNGKEAKKKTQATTEVQKRKMSPMQDDDSPPKKKPKMNSVLEPISPNCPIKGCKDFIPTGVLSREITQLYSERRTLTAQSKYSSRELSGIDHAICAQISWEKKILRLRELGRTRGWPLSTDLPTIVTETLQLESWILSICTDACQLENTVTWNDFLDSIDFKINEFGKTDVGREQRFEYAGLNARCGYLGSIGSELIGSTICRILSKSFADVKRQLRLTIKLALLAESDRIDSETENSSSKDVLRISDFIEYVLVPEIATYLISQDMEVSYLDAIDIRNLSNEHGELNDEISDEQAEHPVLLQEYSPIRDWNQHPNNSPSRKSAKKTKSSANHPKSPLVIPSPKSNPRFGSSKPPKVLRKAVDKPIAPETVELTIADFPPRGSKVKPKAKGLEKSNEANNTNSSKNSKKTKPKPPTVTTDVDHGPPRYTTRSSVRAATTINVTVLP
ncbi:hypothetical protein C8R44DRAFT_987609 [Mycena epipterygia]|nr:hypothetical protein C8R44DRAFT_987609 [Mycena epipterygia]